MWATFRRVWRRMWAAYRRSPRHWFNAIVVVAICFLVASQIAQRTDDPERAVALVALGMLLAALAFWRLPEWQAEAARRHRRGGDKSHFELENEARRTLAEALGGLFLVVDLAFTWAQLDQSRAEQRETATLTREGQITGRFTAAVGQLGDTKLRVRLGGIYALERIARDSKDDAPAVLEVLTAYVREIAPRPLPGTPTPATAGPVPGASLPADVQGVLTVIERERWADQWLPETTGWIPLGLPCLDLSRTDLRGARIHGTNLARMCLRDADLRDARLWDEAEGGASLGGRT